MTSTVPAAYPWATNGHMIRDAVVPLGYLAEDRLTLDPTFGEGVFWRLWRPRRLVACDLVPRKSPLGRGVDMRRLPFRPRTFGAVTLDGPYKLNGTPDPEVDERYGVDVPSTWWDRMQLIRDGMTEGERVLARGGFLLVKCQAQVCSGAVRWQDRTFAAHGEDLGLELVDRFDMLDTGREQPPYTNRSRCTAPTCAETWKGREAACPRCGAPAERIPREQVHAHGRPSTLLVLRKAAR